MRDPSDKALREANPKGKLSPEVRRKARQKAIANMSHIVGWHAMVPPKVKKPKAETGTNRSSALTLFGVNDPPENVPLGHWAELTKMTKQQLLNAIASNSYDVADFELALGESIANPGQNAVYVRSVWLIPEADEADEDEADENEADEADEDS